MIQRTGYPEQDLSNAAYDVMLRVETVIERARKDASGKYADWEIRHLAASYEEWKKLHNLVYPEVAP